MLRHHARAGLDAEEHEGADQDRGGGRTRNAERQQGHEGAGTCRVVGGFGAGHPFYHAGAELLRSLRQSPFQAVGQKGRNGRTGAGEDADKEAEDAAAQHCAVGPLEVVAWGRRRASGSSSSRHELRRMNEVLDHFRQAEHADDRRNEVDPVEQIHAAPGEARRARDDVPRPPSRAAGRGTAR